jgi:tetratricopeptide (TPR) repeat protein
MEKAMRLNFRYPVNYVYKLGFAQRLAGQYEQALSVQQRVISRQPDFLFAYVELASLYSDLDREHEARAAATEVLRLSPDFSLEVMKQRFPYKDATVLERQLAALRRAGLR